MPDADRLKALIRASGLAIGVDLCLILLKYLLAQLTGSPVLLADALHSGADLAVSVTVLISNVIHDAFKGNKWLREVEGLVALLIACVLLFGSFRVVVGSLQDDPALFVVLRGIPLVIAIAGISLAIAATFAMSRFKQQIGERYNSLTFTAEGMHTYADFLSSVGVWLTLCLAYFGIHLERLMTLLVGLAVFHIGLRLGGRAMLSFTVTPTLFSLGKRYTPRRLRARFRYARQTCRRWARHGPMKVSAPFMRADWIAGHKKFFIAANIIFIALLYFGTGVYTVLPYQTGLELFFGKVTEQNPPGLHIHAPKPFGRVIWVDTGVTARLESGFRTRTDFDGQEPEAYLWEFTHTDGRYVKISEESIALTGDEYVADVNFLCYYRITNPVQYALNVANAHETLRSLFGHEVHAEINRYRLDHLLTVDRGKIQDDLLQNLKRAAGQLSLGVTILDVYMREAHPPIAVVPNYRSVVSAQETKLETIHVAHVYKNALLPLSQGQAASIIAGAGADAVEKVSATQGEAESFLAKQQIFSQSEAVQRIRLWWNTVELALKEKHLYILPKKAKRRVYPSGMSASGTVRKVGDEEDENYYGPEEHPEDHTMP
jgi:membrane protease subunit HflK